MNNPFEAPSVPGLDQAEAVDHHKLKTGLALAGLAVVATGAVLQVGEFVEDTINLLQKIF